MVEEARSRLLHQIQHQFEALRGPIVGIRHLAMLQVWSEVKEQTHLVAVLDRAQATQVRQVTLTLLLNASEAMGEGGGTIEVATGEVSCDRERLDRSVLGADSPEGRYAYLAVSDEGSGLADGIQERIFEPFFTTKFAGRGLGLAAVHGIVRAHRGAIEVASVPGRGSRFTVLLPLAQAAPRAPGEGAENG